MSMQMAELWSPNRLNFHLAMAPIHVPYLVIIYSVFSQFSRNFL